MKSIFPLVALLIAFATVQAQIGGGGLNNIQGDYGSFSLYGSPMLSVNPTLVRIADSFFQRITRRLQHAYITPDQRPEAESILREAGANFQRCIDNFETNILNAMHQYKQCLGIQVYSALEQIRSLEMTNRPYGGCGEYGCGHRFGPAA